MCAALEGNGQLAPLPEAKEALPLASDAPADEHAAATDAVTLVLSSLDDSKAEDIVSIDLKGKSALADHMVVASGRSHRHVSAVADHLLRDLKEKGFGNPKVEGLQNGDWVLIDSGDVIIHIFRPEVRSFYNLEKLWSVSDLPDPTVH